MCDIYQRITQYRSVGGPGISPQCLYIVDFFIQFLDHNIHILSSKILLLEYYKIKYFKKFKKKIKK